MKLKNIISPDECLIYQPPTDLEIGNITVNPEECDKNTLLIVPNSDKLPDFSKMIMYPGAVIASPECNIPPEIKSIRTDNPRKSMAYAYSRFYEIDYTKTKFIGITGTNGKTSTATFIRHILKDGGYKVGFIGTGKIEADGKMLSKEYYSMTTPDPEILYKSIAKMQSEDCDAIVMEVSSHSLALSKVAPIIFDYAVFTNLSPEHLDFHGSIDKYYEAKLRLFSQCKVGIFNIDDPHARKAASECTSRKITVGALFRGGVYASNVTDLGFDGSEYLFHGKGFVFKAKIFPPGIYNVYNSMIAAALTADMGIKPCEIKKSLSNVNNIEGRFEIIKGEVTVIIDYAHTDAALKDFLKSIRASRRANQQLTVVFGCGGNRDKEKRPRMAAVAEKYADKIILTSDNPRNEDPLDIITDVMRGFNRKSFSVIEDRKEAITEAILGAQDKAIVAVVGKGAEKYSIDKDGYHEFDEREIISKALEKRHSQKPTT